MVATASPNSAMAAQRHGRSPSHGPRPRLTSSSPYLLMVTANRVRVLSLSRRSAPKAARTKKPRVRSVSAVRLRTRWMPSMARSSPAITPRASDRVRRRTMRAIISTAMVPRSATMNRQPNGLTPKRYSPMPITHLPTGGCTTNEPSLVNASTVRQLLPAVSIRSLCPSTS